MLKASCARTSYLVCTACSLPPGPSPASPKPSPCTKGAPSSRQPPSLLTSHLPPSCLLVSGCTGHFHPRSLHPGPVRLHACPLLPDPYLSFGPPGSLPRLPIPPGSSCQVPQAQSWGFSGLLRPHPTSFQAALATASLSAPPHLCRPFSGPRPLPSAGLLFRVTHSSC